MVLSSYPVQPALYFKWVTLAEWIGIYHYMLQGSYNSVITYILLGPIYIQMLSKLSRE